MAEGQYRDVSTEYPDLYSDLYIEAACATVDVSAAPKPCCISQTPYY